MTGLLYIVSCVKLLRKEVLTHLCVYDLGSRLFLLVTTNDYIDIRVYVLCTCVLNM